MIHSEFYTDSNTDMMIKITQVFHTDLLDPKRTIMKTMVTLEV